MTNVVSLFGDAPEPATESPPPESDPDFVERFTEDVIAAAIYTLGDLPGPEDEEEFRQVVRKFQRDVAAWSV